MIQSRRKYAIIIDYSTLAGEIFVTLASNSVIIYFLLSHFFPFHKVLSVAQFDFLDQQSRT